jgi:hypothetical protein
MIILDSTTKKLQAYTSATPTTDLTYYVSYIDMSSLAVSNIASANGTFDETADDIVPAPGASTQRQIKYMSLHNADSQPHTVTVVLDVSGTDTVLIQTVLQPSYTLIYNNDGKWEVATGPTVFDEALLLPGVLSEPANPASDTLWLYSKNISGRMMPKWKGPSGLDTSVQPFLGQNTVMMMLPQVTTTITLWGMTNTSVGTVATPTLTAGSLSTSMRRWRWTSAATANAASEGRTAAGLVWRGDAAGLGGWFYSCRWGIASTTANQQAAVGLWAATGATATTTVPSNLVNCIFAGWDSADTNLQIMHNDATGTCTKIDLGVNFPANETLAVYEFMMFAPPNGSSVFYRVIRLDTGDVAEGEITTNLPTSTTFLTRHEYMNNGGTAAAVILEVCRIYIETDY